MKIHKFADKKKEAIAITFVVVIVLLVAFYVVFLVNSLTKRVHEVFGRSPSIDPGADGFRFDRFEELQLRPPRIVETQVPAASSAPITASGTASSS